MPFLSRHIQNQNVPGYLVRSVYPDVDGQPIYSLGTVTTDHTTSFSERFGGWYVTGDHGEMRHRGNAIAKADINQPIEFEHGANQLELPRNVNTSDYPGGGSDIVALMILEHQTQAHNLITAANYEVRRALNYQSVMNEALDRPNEYRSDSTLRRIDKAASRLADYMLFRDAEQFESPVKGTSNFQTEFEQATKLDDKGRSIRQLDLQNRLFRYPCSFLICSKSFDELPDQVRTLTLKKINNMLCQLQNDECDADLREHFSVFTPEIAQATHELLIGLKPEYAELASPIQSVNPIN
ncbi:MAG: hypothetical protein R3C03_04795 [Pirellulaceae bacterium]